mmetsp:Transcript_22182/g.32391  ORF Transcript_22182/g.32391 Transcript_22182/m.32391 type:complete len:225 (-) Transcript_22182:88-762(-)|eukprot:CAMPEP_0197244968 /NCGR_PEP_ID=MMETSP1429-20130617/9917_1 /TAXON_ID=49237 /ORGANISM="Chaetoceros  sp., Strain UNC1202" /LENGTH=224 /DNA_ID=CAMNT_0042705399 /DNA_START=387 /DNA_END=1061 /DNA_ORIENTATION=+
MQPTNSNEKKTLPRPLQQEVSPKSTAQMPACVVQSSFLAQSASSISRSATDDASLSEYDVLFGRGGGTNRHAGNIYFRTLVSEKQPAYVQSRKSDKTLIAKSIVAQIRSMNGRFLKVDTALGEWVDVGDKKATEKTSQALREGLSGRMREIVRTGGVGVQHLRKAGYSEYSSRSEINQDEIKTKLDDYYLSNQGSNGGTSDGSYQDTFSDGSFGGRKPSAKKTL